MVGNLGCGGVRQALLGVVWTSKIRLVYLTSQGTLLELFAIEMVLESNATCPPIQTGTARLHRATLVRARCSQMNQTSLPHLHLVGHKAYYQLWVFNRRQPKIANETLGVPQWTKVNRGS